MRISYLVLKQNNMQKSILLFLLHISLSVSGQTSKTRNMMYDKDRFSPSALLDLRYLNESYAGEHGFIKLSADGNSFVRGDGIPIRFWATNISSKLLNQNLNEIDSVGRYFSKMGFNMVRYHGSVNPKGEKSDLNVPDSAEIDRIWKFVAGMKKNGIYTTISPFWANKWHLGGNIPKEWGIDGYSGREDLFGVMFFNDKLKAAYKKWVKQLYTEVNPYTGIALNNDPAVGIIQIKNEDGVFFWTMSQYKPELKKLVQQKFSKWLKKKYGSVANALNSWKNEHIEGDNFANNLPELYSIYDMTLEQSGNKALRLNDQVEFYAETQRNFYSELHDFYRKELGCMQLINGNNWKTADVLRLNDLERWTNSTCEVIAVNRYVNAEHYGTSAGWKISPGDYYVGKSALKSPEMLPTNIKQIQGHPLIITESGWNLPNKHQIEGPFLSAAYQSLTGIDALYWYNVEDLGFSNNPYLSKTGNSDSTHSLSRWNLSIPGCMGMMPANALIYRLGYVKKSDILIHEERSVGSLLKREVPLISESSTFDPNRDVDFSKVGNTKNVGFSPMIFLAGGVEVKYTEKPQENRINKNIDLYIDNIHKIVNSTTKELSLDYGNGIATVNTAFVQGVCGFLNVKKNFSLSDVKIQSSNEYASVQIVSMDQRPITTSKRILIQVGTTYIPTDWKEITTEFTEKKQKLKGFQIKQTGRMPWQGQNIDATVEINNSTLSKATLLSTSGYSQRNLKVEKVGGKLKITLPINSMYVIVE